MVRPVYMIVYNDPGLNCVDTGKLQVDLDKK